LLPGQIKTHRAVNSRNAESLGREHRRLSCVALPADKPLEDIGRYIPMASSELRFSKLQLNLSIPQAAMSATARLGGSVRMG
jgi:outer membrane usher protein FimD/PapC